MSVRKIQFPCAKEDFAGITAGEAVSVSGVLYTARDAAHARIVHLLELGRPLPFDPMNQAIYYCGPCPTPPGSIIGSCGPTSAVRMDAYAPLLYDLGLCAVLAKGPVSKDVRAAISRNSAVYLCCTGGAGALIAHSVKESSVFAFEDLGPESIKRIVVEDLPAITGIDPQGRSLFWSGDEP